MRGARQEYESASPQEELGMPTEKKSFDHPVADLPKNGGNFLLKKGTVITTPDMKSIEVGMDVLAEIGLPSREIEMHRQLNSPRVLAYNKEKMNVVRDRRDVIIDYRVVGYVYGAETYQTETYPDED